MNDDLIVYALGGATPEQARAAEARIASDPAAAAEFAAISSTLEAVARYRDCEPRRALTDRVTAAFGDSPAGASRRGRWRQWLEEVAAAVLLDTRGTVALAGFRGGEEGYQLVLSSGAADVDLQVLAPRADGEPWVVLGQIEQEGVETRGTVFVWRPGSDEVPWETESDTYGVFRLELPVGTYNVSVLVGSVAVRLPPLEIG